MQVQAVTGPLALVKPVVALPRLENLSILTHIKDPNIELAAIWEGRTDASDPMALDLETRGVNPLSPEAAIVGIGLADSRGSVYIDLTTSDPSTLGMVMAALEGNEVPLVAHNLPFDASFIYAKEGWFNNWKYCTLALYKLLATEGWPGQTWGLKDAQRQLLGWEETNETELDNWLIANEYIADTKKDEKAGHYWVEEKQRWVKPKKEEMWRAPAEILGKYCALDAESTYLLFTRVLLPALRSTTGGQLHLEDSEHGYYSKVYQRYLQILIQQRFHGITINRTQLSEYNQTLLQSIASKEAEFLSHPEVAPHAEVYRDAILADHWAAEPPKYKKEKVKPKEPEKLNKKGEVSGRWRAWKARVDNWPEPEISQRWIEWKAKEAKLLDETKLNINSGQQKQWLFYERLGYKPMLFTESGQPAVDAKALQGFGEPGQILIQQNEMTKEQGYVQAVLDNLKDTLLHTQYRIPGTLTGRLSGSGGVNCFLPGTELLTKRGWVDVLHVTEHDYVWQVEPLSKVGSWTKPQAIIKQEWDGEVYHFGGQRGELAVTANHRMAWYGAKNQKHKYLYTREACAGIDTKRATILGGSESIEFPSHLYREIWIAAMLQADGSCPKGKSYVVGFRKERKVKRAEELVGHVARKVVYKSGITYFRQIEFSSNLLCAKTKTFTLSNLSTHHAAELLQAVSFWDGNVITVKDGIRVEYNSMIKKNVDELQAYFSRAGYHTSVRKYKGWRLYITNNLHREYRPERHMRITNYTGPVGCVSVPTEHLLVRSGGLVWVSGNCQQMPKSAKFLETWVARPGYSLVEFDFTALEQVVLAELSRDKSLWKLYGPGAKPNDAYLFTGAYLPVIGKQIRAAGYDPDNPTAEGIQRAKKEAKAARQIAKVVALASAYGAGAPKIAQTLRLSGIDISDAQAKDIHAGYWNLYSGVKEYEAELVNQWERNRGWIYNGIGRPIAIADTYLKDIINRTCQSTGHDLLVYFLVLTADRLDQYGIEWYPWIADWHDEFILEVKDEDVTAAVNLIDNALLTEFNKLVGGRIALKGNAEVAKTLADIKCRG